MRRKTDDLGRIVIPSEMRKELDIQPEQEVEIEKVGRKIIITNVKGMLSREEVQLLLNDVSRLEENEYNKGFKDALKMVMKKEGTNENNN